jgi:hypothetical protein
MNHLIQNQRSYRLSHLAWCFDTENGQHTKAGYKTNFTMQRLARKVLQCEGWRENKFYNGKADEKIIHNAKVGEKITSQCKGWRENQFYNAKASEKLSFTMQRLTRK